MKIIYEEVLKEFNKQKIKYIIVGGLAVNLLGYLRSTQDLDVLVEMTEDNLKKIVKILVRLGFSVKQPVNPMKVADYKVRKDWIENKNMKAFNFYKHDLFPQEVDIIIETPVDYNEAKRTVEHIKIDKLMLPVISIKNLIKMKNAAKRNVDTLDIINLKEIAKEVLEDLLRM